MMSPLSGFKWWNSAAHLLLLSRFLTPQPAEDFLYSEGWERALGESPRRALDRFLEEGLLQHAGLAERVAHRYEVDELEAMLQRRGLLPTGDKDDLIEILLRVDPDVARADVDDVILLECTQTGRRMAEQFLAEEADERHAVEQRVLAALKDRRFKEAGELVVEFESSRVLPGGYDLSITPRDVWKHHDAARDAMILRRLFTVRSADAERLDEGQLEQLRLAAAMMYLWGTETIDPWLPEEFSWQEHVDPTEVGQSLVTAALQQTADAMVDVAQTAPRLTRQGVVDRTATARSRDEVPRLSGLDLRGLDLSGVNLTDADLRYTDLSFADLSGAHLANANLAYANLHQARLRFARLHGANLHAADLSEADLFGADLNEAVLDEADLTGVDFSDVYR